MKTFRSKLKAAVIAALPLAASCSGSKASTAAGSNAASASSSGGAGSSDSSSTSGTGTSGGSSGSSGSGTGGTIGGNLCDQCITEGLICNVTATACVDPCSMCDCTHSYQPVGSTDGGFPDGGLSLPLCRAACPNPNVAPDGGGNVSLIWTVLSCGIDPQGCAPLPDGGDAGAQCVDCRVEQDCGASGRAPEGLEVYAPSGSASALGSWFSQMAYLESASVAAFANLAAELWHHGAPEALIRQAEEAGADEVRHAARAGELARRFGGQVRPARVNPAPVRSLAALARENEVEGCVRETLGAALAAYQSLTARDSEIRAAMAGIAADEASHAELAWRVAEWVEPQLSIEDRQRLRAARAQAVAEIALSEMPDAQLVELAGVPHPRAEAALVAELTRLLWDSGELAEQV